MNEIVFDLVTQDLCFVVGFVRVLFIYIGLCSLGLAIWSA